MFRPANSWIRERVGGTKHTNIPVKDPMTEQIVNRGGFNLHTGRESDGCITVESDIDNSNPKYPQSKSYDDLRDFINKAGETPFHNPRKPTQKFLGIMLVKKCLKDGEKAVKNYK